MLISLVSQWVVLAMPAFAPVESSELDMAGLLPCVLEVDGGVGSTVVGNTELVDEDTADDEGEAGTGFIEEIVRLVEVTTSPVCVVMVDIVDISVVVRMEVNVGEETTTVVGVSTETIVVVNEGGGPGELE